MSNQISNDDSTHLDNTTSTGGGSDAMNSTTTSSSATSNKTPPAHPAGGHKLNNTDSGPVWTEPGDSGLWDDGDDSDFFGDDSDYTGDSSTIGGPEGGARTSHLAYAAMAVLGLLFVGGIAYYLYWAWKRRKHMRQMRAMGKDVDGPSNSYTGNSTVNPSGSTTTHQNGPYGWRPAAGLFSGTASNGQTGQTGAGDMYPLQAWKSDANPLRDSDIEHAAGSSASTDVANATRSNLPPPAYDDILPASARVRVPGDSVVRAAGGDLGQGQQNGVVSMGPAATGDHKTPAVDGDVGASVMEGTGLNTGLGYGTSGNQTSTACNEVGNDVEDAWNNAHDGREDHTPDTRPSAQPRELV